MKKMKHFVSMMLFACIAIFSTSCAEEGSPADSIQGSYNGTYTIYTIVNSSKVAIADPITDANMIILAITNSGATMATPTMSFNYTEDETEKTATLPGLAIPISVEEATNGYAIHGIYDEPTLNANFTVAGTVKGEYIEVVITFSLGKTPFQIEFSNRN